MSHHHIDRPISRTVAPSSTPAQVLQHESIEQPWLAPVCAILSYFDIHVNNVETAPTVCLHLSTPETQTSPFVVIIKEDGTFLPRSDNAEFSFDSKEDRKFTAGITHLKEYLENIHTIQEIAAELNITPKDAHQLFIKPWALFLVRSVLKAHGSGNISPAIRSLEFGTDYAVLTFFSPEAYGRGPWTNTQVPFISVFSKKSGYSSVNLFYGNGPYPEDSTITDFVEELYAPLRYQAARSTAMLRSLAPLFSQIADKRPAQRAAFAYFWMIPALLTLAKHNVKINDLRTSDRNATIAVTQDQADEGSFSGSISITQRTSLKGRLVSGNTEAFQQVLRALQTRIHPNGEKAPAPKVSFARAHSSAKRPAYGAFSSLNSVSARGCDHL